MSAIDRFRDLHVAGTFVMPNAWDIGSARLLEQLGFVALATTSSGHAGSLGRLDQHVSRDELVAHAETLATSVGVPLSVDAGGMLPRPARRRGADGEPARHHRRGRMLHRGLRPSHRHDPAARRRGSSASPRRSPEPEPVASCSPRAPRTTCTASTTSTTRSPGFVAYREQGADVLYAPGLAERADIERIVREAGRRSTCWPARGRRASPSSPPRACAGCPPVARWLGSCTARSSKRAASCSTRGTTSYLARSLTAADRVAAFEH